MSRQCDYSILNVLELLSILVLGSIHTYDLLGVSYLLNNGFIILSGHIRTCYLVNVCVE